MKQCTRCKAEKADDLFSPWKRGKDGLSCWCKACNCEVTKARYAALTPGQRKKLNRRRRGPAASPERRRARYAADTEHRERDIANSRSYYQRLRQRVYEGYGGKCACCGESELMFLELDHVNGGGAKEYRSIPPATVYLRLVKSGFPAGYQLLCSNCNTGKHRNGGVCPHKAKR